MNKVGESLGNKDLDSAREIFEVKDEEIQRLKEMIPHPNKRETYKEIL